MTFDQINWLYVAGAVSAVLLVTWSIATLRARPGVIAIIVSFAHLVAAALNSVAPLRGPLDPDYLGYGFGLITAHSGLSGAAMAAAVFLTALLGAFSALRKSREAMLITAVTSLIFLVVLGWPWLQDMLDGLHTSIQLGDGVIVPGYLFKGVLAVFMVGPFLLGLIWSTMRARTAPSGAVA